MLELPEEELAEIEDLGRNWATFALTTAFGIGMRGSFIGQWGKGNSYDVGTFDLGVAMGLPQDYNWGKRHYDWAQWQSACLSGDIGASLARAGVFWRHNPVVGPWSSGVAMSTYPDYICGGTTEWIHG